MRIAVDGRNLAVRSTGIPRYLLELCDALLSRGHEIHLFLPSKPDGGTVLPPDARVDIAAYPGAAGRQAWSAFSLPRRVAAADADVFWGPAHRLPRGLPATLPRVVTIHDLVWRRAAQTMRWRGWLADSLLMRRAVAAADTVCAVSNATAADIADAFPEARARIAVVSPPVSGLASVRPAEDLGRFGIVQPYVLFVGTLEPRKNLRGLIRAFGRLPAALRLGHQLVICGGKGWGSEDAMRLAQEAGVADRVRLTGHVSDAELAGLYAGARCLAMPSLLEGFGLPIVEAQRFGVPVVTSDRSSMPEVAGEGALLADPLDCDAVADALERLLGDDDAHRKLSGLARLNAGRFTREASAAAMEDAFEKAVARRREEGAP